MHSLKYMYLKLHMLLLLLLLSIISLLYYYKNKNNIQTNVQLVTDRILRHSKRFLPTNGGESIGLFYDS